MRQWRRLMVVVMMMSLVIVIATTSCGWEYPDSEMKTRVVYNDSLHPDHGGFTIDTAWVGEPIEVGF